ncbi:enoyl-CoA hydratase/isomerase family protein [Pseudomonas sp. SLFW]|uniref:enoyl-CoA hydratase/isomerase family protein n=1 Tax=Pseudomonas sp. SLFW TaxID=2683259 RepID=UPI0014134C61|nr:enoyl-CoA hydratase/isomerase family protein [Pseudomonas sp. SLFW]NBB13161.1 enoyl-CoA hydratase/isomerase family protein [Pseudomonas sp. SLFW]
MESDTLPLDAQAPVTAQVRNRIGHLTLNQPATLNALTLPMIRALHQHLQAWADDPEVLAVVLRAEGEKAFCAGGDIRSLYNSFQADDSLHRVFFEEEYALDHCLHVYPKPTVALMDGLVLGGGMGLVQGTTFRVITGRAKMAMPEVGIGYFPDVGGSYFLSRLPGQLGVYLGVTGVQARAADALYAGLADVCLPRESLEAFDQRLDALQWENDPTQTLRTLVTSMTTKLLPGAELKAMRRVIDEYFALPDIVSIRDALSREDRPAYRDWAEETIKVLDSRSPLAMAVTLELIRRGRSLSLAQCFALELHLDRQWFAKGDIMEGVRALIIDKDKTPRWNPPNIEALPHAQVLAFFDGHPVHTLDTLATV